MQVTRPILWLAASLSLLTSACQGTPVGVRPASPSLSPTLESSPQAAAPVLQSDAPVPIADTNPTPSPAPSQPAASCPPPWRICATTTATGNFDGRSAHEVFTASPIWSGSDSISDWLLDASLPAGRSVSARLSSLTAALGSCSPEQLGSTYAVVRGAANFRGSAGDLALVEIQRGASTRFGILVGIQNGRLQVATVANGGAYLGCQRLFAFGGSVTHGDGLACGWRNDAPVLQVRWVLDHPPAYTPYDWYQATYAWHGLQLDLLSLDHAVITDRDPRFGPSYVVRCGGINIPD